MIRRFHLFAHHQHVAPLMRTAGGMEHYIAPFATADEAKAHLATLNSNLVATKGGTAAYEYAQVAMLVDNGGLAVVATFDGQTGWCDHNECASGACDGNGPLEGYIVRRPVKDRAPIGFAASDALIDAAFGGKSQNLPMGYVLVTDPRPGEEIYHGRFDKRTMGFSTAEVDVYDPVGAFSTTRFGE